MTHKNHSERGNVLIYILVAVGLIGALTFAVTNSSQDSGNINEERAKVMATDLLEYSNIVANAVGKLRLRGCVITQLNFDHPDLTGYDNTNSPSDSSCDIFNLSGGSIQYSVPEGQTLVGGTSDADAVWGFYGSNEIEDVAQDCNAASCAELIMALENVRSEVCLATNDFLGIINPNGSPPTDTHLDKTAFAGTMTYAQSIGDEAGGENLLGRRAGCYAKTGAPASNVFYKVLQAR